MEKHINTTYFGDCMSILPELIESGVKAQMCVTSIPYWGLRKYLKPGHPMEAYEIGCEPTLDEYLQRIVGVIRLVRDVLSDDGTLWLNVGDAYTSGNRSPERFDLKYAGRIIDYRHPTPEGLKPKDLIGLPWRVAFALQADGWWLRSDIVWQKPNPMPESVKDRPTRAHEFIFLLSKQQRYYYDADSIKEPVTGNSHARGSGVNPKAEKVPSGWNINPGSHTTKEGRYRPRQNPSFSAAVKSLVDVRNKRSVWTIAAAKYKGAHFATFPPDLIKPCILAGSRSGDIVLDPFGGSGTTAQVAQDLGRRWILIEINEDYKSLITERTAQQSLGI